MTSIQSLSGVRPYSPYVRVNRADDAFGSNGPSFVAERRASRIFGVDLPGERLTSQRFSSGTFGTLLRSQEAGGVNTAPKAMPEPPPGETANVGVGYFLTEADKRMITAATGYHFDSEGCPCDANGKRLESCPANCLIGQISSERFAGSLRGEITPEYLQDLFQRFASHGEAQNPEWLKKSLDYLSGRTAGKAAEA